MVTGLDSPVPPDRNSNWIKRLVPPEAYIRRILNYDSDGGAVGEPHSGGAMKERLRFLPSLEGLEARDVPASFNSGALFNAVLQTLVNQSIMQGVAQNMIALGHPSAQFTAGPVMQQVVAESNAAEKTLGELQAYMQVQVAANPFMSGAYVKLWGAVAELEAQDQMNEAMARNVGQ